MKRMNTICVIRLAWQTQHKHKRYNNDDELEHIEQLGQLEHIKRIQERQTIRKKQEIHRITTRIRLITT